MIRGFDVSISIHAPVKGATLIFHGILINIMISIHAPVKGATLSAARTDCGPCAISIHAPVKGATTGVVTLTTANIQISIHAPVKGATSNSPIRMPVYSNFNPRTREGCDGTMTIDRFRDELISIHAPVKGATAEQEDCERRLSQFQSTHP